MFYAYLQLGFDHISDLKGYDHILFIVALCAVFSATEWKKILILVTAFTFGHSVTLAMAALNLIKVDPYIIELLIPVTILLTALQNFWYKPDVHRKWHLNYLLALCFGFIHGMGFSNYFRSLLGQEADIVLPLFAFNIGVELGQLAIVASVMVMDYLVVKRAGIKQQYWNYTISGIAVILSIMMFIERV